MHDHQAPTKCRRRRGSPRVSLRGPQENPPEGRDWHFRHLALDSRLVHPTLVLRTLLVAMERAAGSVVRSCRAEVLFVWLGVLATGCVFCGVAVAG